MSTSRNVLVTCGGKWAGMIIQIREAMLGIPELSQGRIIVTSSDALTPAGCFADEAVQVPLIRDPMYVERLLEVCESRRVRVVIPLIDLDLQRLAPHLDRFSAIGVTVICPPPCLVELCFDKLSFARFASANNLKHLPTFIYPELDGLRFPAFYKLRCGFGSIGSGICRNSDEATTVGKENANVVFQELVRTEEVTVDAYISVAGKCTICVPRLRDKVVAGESYKSHTVQLPEARELAMRTITALAREGLRGPLNVQIFLTDPPALLEVNTRLGSASVLSNVASGGRLLHSLLIEALGIAANGDPADYIVDLHLNRYLGDVFHRGTEVIAIKPASIHA